MDKEALLGDLMSNKDPSSHLSHQLPIKVVTDDQYIPPLISGAEEDMGTSFSSLGHVVDSVLSDQIRTIAVVGSAGSGKTTALEKFAVDWAKGDHCQTFSNVFFYDLKELSFRDGLYSLKTFLLQNRHPFDPESTALVLQKPENVMFVFDTLDLYKHPLDPSVHTLCTDPNTPTTVSTLVASLLHGTLLKGATFLVATRPTDSLAFLEGFKVELSGFSKPQREAYFGKFFPDPHVANIAWQNMERTLGFYDFGSSPYFCWTVCSVYKNQLGAGEGLAETMTEICVNAVAQVVASLALDEVGAREVVLALGRVAAHCCIDPQSTCCKERIASSGLKQLLAAPVLVESLLRVDGDLESDQCVLSFHSQLMQELLLAVSFLLDETIAEDVSALLNTHEGHVRYLHLYLAGLLNAGRRRPLESLLGPFKDEQLMDFKRWLKTSSQKTLEGHYKEKHLKAFGLLHQSQDEVLVREVVTPSARIDLSYAGLGLVDCVALNYVVQCLGGTERLNLYSAKDLTEEGTDILIPAMGLSQKIMLSSTSLSAASVGHIARALREGITSELDLSHTQLGDANLKVLCSGLRACKLHALNILACGLTEACCGDLSSALTSSASQLSVLNLMFNELGDQGLLQLCQALENPLCKLQELQLRSCQVTAQSMEALSTALCSGQSQLRMLDLDQNTVGDVGAEHLSRALQHPHCRLQRLTLSDTELTGSCCQRLAQALRSDHCSLVDLDLSVNELGPDGALRLCKALRNPGCPLEKLSLTRCELTQVVFAELGLVLRSEGSRLKSLSLALNGVGDQGMKSLWKAIADPCCLLEDLSIEMTELTDASAGALCAALRASRSLKTLDLSNNQLTDAAIPALVQVVQDSPFLQEVNLKYNDLSEDVSQIMDQCGKIRY